MDKWTRKWKVCSSCVKYTQSSRTVERGRIFIFVTRSRRDRNGPEARCPQWCPRHAFKNDTLNFIHSYSLFYSDIALNVTIPHYHMMSLLTVTPKGGDTATTNCHFRITSRLRLVLNVTGPAFMSRLSGTTGLRRGVICDIKGMPPVPPTATATSRGSVTPRRTASWRTCSLASTAGCSQGRCAARCSPPPTRKCAPAGSGCPVTPVKPVGI